MFRISSYENLQDDEYSFRYTYIFVCIFYTYDFVFYKVLIFIIMYIFRELNTQAEEADSLIDSIIKVGFYLSIYYQGRVLSIYLLSR